MGVVGVGGLVAVPLVAPTYVLKGLGNAGVGGVFNGIAKAITFPFRNVIRAAKQDGNTWDLFNSDMKELDENTFSQTATTPTPTTYAPPAEAALPPGGNASSKADQTTRLTNVYKKALTTMEDGSGSKLEIAAATLTVTPAAVTCASVLYSGNVEQIAIAMLKAYVVANYSGTLNLSDDKNVSKAAESMDPPEVKGANEVLKAALETCVKAMVFKEAPASETTRAKYSFSSDAENYLPISSKGPK